jgi:Fic family protein
MLELSDIKDDSRSKQKHIVSIETLDQKQRVLSKQFPLSKEIRGDFIHWEKVELTYHSNTIEGNTLTKGETAEVLNRGLKAVINKPLKDQIEALNHEKAMNYIISLSEKYKSHQFISEENIREINQFILNDLSDWAGLYRRTIVHVGGSNYERPHHDQVPSLMKELVDYLKNNQEDHPIKIAADVHTKLLDIHPFIDGNGRTARLLMNLILLIHKYPVSIIKSEERVIYFEALEKSFLSNNRSDLYNIIYNAIDRSLDEMQRYFK